MLLFRYTLLIGSSHYLHVANALNNTTTVMLWNYQKYLGD